MTLPSNSHRSGDPRGTDLDRRTLVEGFLSQCRRPSARAKSAARHFLIWADAHRIAIRDLNAEAVDRFSRHRCRCGPYSPDQLKDPSYIADVRRFLRYLEDRGVVVVPEGGERLDGYLPAFAVSLTDKGYSKPAHAGRLSQARHFGEWLAQSRILTRTISEASIEKFARHDCRCGIRTKRGQLVDGTGITIFSACLPQRVFGFRKLCPFAAMI